MNLVDRLAQFFERFVFIKEKSIFRLLALWTIQTHCFKAFEDIGYIFAYSPEPECGKSTVLKVLDLLVANSSGLYIDATPPILFRGIEESETQLFDELDSWKEENRLNATSILNAGSNKQGVVPRMVQGRDGKWTKQNFACYAPRAFCAIDPNHRLLRPATLSRCFLLSLTKQTRAERREKFRHRNLKGQGKALHDDIKQWAEANLQKICAIYTDDPRPIPYLQHLGDRTIDLTSPLASILEVAYAGQPELRDRRMDLLDAIRITRKDGAEFVGDHLLLQELARLAIGAEPLIGSASELASRFPEPKPNEHELSATLRRYGFESKSVRQGDSIRYRYVVSRGELDDLCVRYAEAADRFIDLGDFYEEPGNDVVTVVGITGGIRAPSSLPNPAPPASNPLLPTLPPSDPTTPTTFPGLIDDKANINMPNTVEAPAQPKQPTPRLELSEEMRRRIRQIEYARLH